MQYRTLPILGTVYTSSASTLRRDCPRLFLEQLESRDTSCHLNADVPRFSSRVVYFGAVVHGVRDAKDASGDETRREEKLKASNQVPDNAILYFACCYC